MTRRAVPILSFAVIGLLAAGLAGWTDPLDAQRISSFSSPKEARAELARAQEQSRKAQLRAEKLSAEAAAAGEAADKSAREAAALAARIQQTEADLAAGEARLALITDQRRQLDARLARKQQPLVRLMAALQNMARRPLALSALRPGSLKDTVYVRAVLETSIPQIRKQTATLRGELARGKELEVEAGQAVAALRSDETELLQRQQQLATLATQQRAASRQASGIALRENDRALALAEQARDLDDLVGTLDQAGQLRRELASLPGPVLRPAKPGEAEVALAGPTPTPTSTAPPAGLQLPVGGRTLSGFGAIDAAGVVSDGITLAPRSGAQVVAPAAGRVLFAGAYRGFGQIVIIEHANGWTSLVTGLGSTGVAVGDHLVGGSPIGNAPGSNPAITLELRREGDPVNPLQYMD
ncbi:murein hydrolase activator EnvC family protein [Altererythrobacter sp.]|uniref:murein hydrolase activator EnvC family protein n=1 Tax=Altererythrobacter sp. TaxID=1872480 RepID=UPI003CFE1D10